MRLLDRSTAALAVSILAVALTGACSAATSSANPPQTEAPAQVSTETPTPKATSTPTKTPEATPTPTHTRIKKPPVKIHTPRPRPTPTKTRPPAKPAVRTSVHPGAFCAPQGAHGRTSAGTLMRCSSRGGDQARWRRA